MQSIPPDICTDEKHGPGHTPGVVFLVLSILESVLPQQFSIIIRYDLNEGSSLDTSTVKYIVQ